MHPKGISFGAPVVENSLGSSVFARRLRRTSDIEKNPHFWMDAKWGIYYILTLR